MHRTWSKVVLGAAVVVGGGLAGCSWSDDDPAGSAGVLFVLDTPSSMVEISGDDYRLVVPSGENLLWFTERPERLAGTVSFDHWLEDWERNGFDTDPPNAALVVDQGDGVRTHIVELSDPKVEAEQVSFALTDIEPEADGTASHAGRTRTHELQAGSMAHTELFIDSVSCSTACTTTTPVTSSALSGAGAAELLAKFPAGSVSASSVQLGPNLSITSMSVTKNADGSFAGSGTITLGGVVGLTVDAAFTDAANWTLTVASAGSPSVQLGSSGITLDPSTISGTIVDSGGTVTWNLSGSTITWPIASGASLTTQFSIGTACPFSTAGYCPSGNNLYVGLPNGSLAISGLPTVALQGGITLDGQWARLQGSANASASFSVAGASVSMSSPSLTVWRGPRSDSYDPNMVMPDTSALTAGTNLEFCGNFGITIPTLVNQATGGCARWTPNGIVLGQVGTGPGMTLSGGTVPTGTTADVKGIGWSSLSAIDIGKLTLPNGGAAGSISFSGVATGLFPSSLSLGGKAHLPGIVASALGFGSVNVDVDVTGQIAKDSFSLQGTVPVKINFGNEPFKVSVQSMSLGLKAGTGQGFSMTLGTASDVTLGYGTSARVVRSSITLAAATAPAPGFTLSLSAVGTPGGGDTTSGLTPSTRLAHPSQATYLVPDMFGINGLNLWSLTGQIGWQGASPSLAFGTTTYLNPTGSSTKSVMSCTGTCDDADWMVGNLLLDVSATNPCFAYSFDSTSGGGSIGIDGGVMKASKFQIGMSPNGCSLQAGTTTITLPKGFAGFAFSAAFGDATVDVATQVSVDGFLFNTSISNIVLGGFNLNTMSLNVSITPTASNVVFDALTSINSFGTMAFHADMSSNSSGMSWNVTGDICTDTTGTYCKQAKVAAGSTLAAKTSGPSSPEPARDANGNTTVAPNDRQPVGFQLVQLHFQQNGAINSCSTLDTMASGYLKMSGTTYKLLSLTDNAKLPDGSPFGGSGFKVDCRGIQYAGFGITFTHDSAYLNTSVSATKTLLLSWNGSTKTLEGSYSVAMQRHVDVDKGSYHYNEWQYFDINVAASISSTAASFQLSGHVHSGRVDGYLDFYLNSSGDFVGKVHLSVDVPWSDSTYHVDWDNL